LVLPTGSYVVHVGFGLASAVKPVTLNGPTVRETFDLPAGGLRLEGRVGDANAMVRSDIRVAAGKLTDVTVTHRAAAITLKLVAAKGGEALANTAWSVLTPGGDVIKESIGA